MCSLHLSQTALKHRLFGIFRARRGYSGQAR